MNDKRQELRHTMMEMVCDVLERENAGKVARIAIVDEKRDQTGPLGGISSTILGVFESRVNDNGPIPFLISIYADERIEGLLAEVLQRRLAEEERKLALRALIWPKEEG